mgnify:CR=1 FL=1
MAITGSVSVEELIPALTSQLNQISLWLTGLSVFVILGIIYSVAMFFIERKKIKIIEKISHDIKRLESKVDKIYIKR